MATISWNPQLTNAPQNSFLTETEGYVQGGAWDDPSARLWLAEGTVASSVTQPIWGGRAIGELVSAINANATGPSIELAAANTDVTGFTVFNQAHNMIITPGATVP
ncbi:MAG: hypothetical protein KGI54_18935, partial [Pseudomonadota bacterium]|nr:hypothetical protein [Pseudomonadota bacterium]